MSDDESHELATVTRLPVHDAEIVTPEEWAALQQRKARDARLAGYRGDVVTVARVTRTAVTHPVTKSTARHAYYVAAGAATIVRRRHARKTLPDRMARTAEQVGDSDKAEKWFTLGETSRASRHKRRMDWLEMPFRAAKALVVAILLWFAALLLLGVVVAFTTKDAGRAFDPLIGFVTFIGWLWWALTVSWAILLVLAGTLAVTVLWWVGKTSGAAPRWMAKTQERDNTITPSLVVTAFRDLGIAELRKRIVALDDGGAMLLTSPIVTSGCGVEFDVTPPRGATDSATILARHGRLAENLYRHGHEVHMSIPAPGTVRVWAADSGALDEPIGPSPLALDNRVRGDYRRGKAPWGVNLRGDPIEISLYQRHLLVVGISNQGKTFSVRALALWLALDTSVELRICDLKGAGDWAMFAGVATVLIQGPTDDHVIEATEMLEGGVREMERRLNQGGAWTPLVLIVDEAQQAYMCPAKDQAGRPYGGKQATSRYLTAVRKIQNQGRAVDVVLWQGTQNPTDQNLPVLAREGAHLRISTAVGKKEQSVMALGDKAVDGGAAPHLLRAGLDKGVVVVAGDGAPLEPGQSSVTIRTHLIDGVAAEEITRRAKSLRGPVRHMDEEEVRDLLDDVHEAIGGDDWVRASDMAARLRELAPGYRLYGHLDGTRLSELLGAEGVEVKRKDGYPVVRADRVLRALDMRQGVQ